MSSTTNELNDFRVILFLRATGCEFNTRTHSYIKYRRFNLTKRLEAGNSCGHANMQRICCKVIKNLKPEVVVELQQIGIDKYL